MKKPKFALLLSILAVSLLVLTPLLNSTDVMMPKVSADLVPPEQECAITGWVSEDGSSPAPFTPTTYGPLNVTCFRSPSHNSPFIYVVVNSSLYSSISFHLDRYATDVENTGLGVYVWVLSSGSPEGIRGFFASAGSDLVGCLLVGDIPSAWYQMYHVPPWDHTEYEEFPIDLFYMDLDGTWSDTLSPPYPGSLGPDGIYDVHEDGTGDVGPEIWIGRIKADNMADPEVSLIQNYFDKNHAYRIGCLDLPQRALVYVDDDWTPGTGVYNDVKLAYTTSTLVNDNATTRKEDYLDRLEDQWSWVHLKCHGSSGSHTFKVPNATGHSVWEPWSVTSNDYRIGDYPVFFYNLFVCSGARFTSPDYLGGWCIFAPTYGLAAVGSTKTGSMNNDGDFYDPLGDGKTLGEAFKEWVASTAETSRAWYYGMTVIGDPVLTIYPPDNDPPVADANGPYYCSLGSTVLLDASGSYDPDPGDSIVLYEWDLDNNGVYEISTSSPTYLYTWIGDPLPGSVTLRVTDVLGCIDTDTTTITTYGVELTLSPTSQDIVPGDWGTYDLTVKNLGNVNDVIILSLTGLPATWDFTMAPSVILSGLTSTTVQISIKPYKDCTTTPGNYPFTVTGVSSMAFLNHGWLVFDIVAGNVHVLPYYVVEIFIAPASFTVKPGETATYTVSVHNLGNVLETFDITLTYHDFGLLYEAFPTAIQPAWVILADYTLTLNPCNTATTTLIITVPVDWAGMEDATYTFDVTATSQTDPTADDTASASLTVEATKRSMVEYIKLEIIWKRAEVAASGVDPYFQRLADVYLRIAQEEMDKAIEDILNGLEMQANNHLSRARIYIWKFYKLIDSYRTRLPPLLADEWQQQAEDTKEDINTAISTPI